LSRSGASASRTGSTGRSSWRTRAKTRRGSRPEPRCTSTPRGAELCVPRAELPPPGENEYYAFELVGLEVSEDGGRELGRVAAVQPGVANDVLELDSGIALPLVDACVLDVDLAQGRIRVAPGFAA
jgi:16S rRNA processing protein RimM